MWVYTDNGHLVNIKQATDIVPRTGRNNELIALFHSEFDNSEDYSDLAKRSTLEEIEQCKEALWSAIKAHATHFDMREHPAVYNLSFDDAAKLPIGYPITIGCVREGMYATFQGMEILENEESVLCAKHLGGTGGDIEILLDRRHVNTYDTHAIYAGHVPLRQRRMREYRV